MDVRLQGRFRLLSPLSHIGESISATSYLVQEPVIQADGRVREVFVYSGNAWRGQLRDLAALYMLDALGSPRLPLEAFHLLFAGGRIGGTQSTNIEQARQYRRLLPVIALWGGGIGNQILPGKLRVRNCYPLVQEALPVLASRDHEEASRTPYSAITFEKSFSRKDDSKNEHLAERLLPAQGQQQSALMMGGDSGEVQGKVPKDSPEQMRMTVELVAAGASLATAIDVLDCSEVELGCLVSALHRFSMSPFIGGQGNRGHGEVALQYQMVNLDTGEVQPFLSVADGRSALAPPAEQALDAYDRHVREIYDGYLSERGSEAMALLGAKAR